jgi:hypothetical protein
MPVMMLMTVMSMFMPAVIMCVCSLLTIFRITSHHMRMHVPTGRQSDGHRPSCQKQVRGEIVKARKHNSYSNFDSLIIAVELQ